MSDQHIFPDRLKNVLPRVHGRRQYGSVDNIRRGRKILSEERGVKETQGSIGTSRVRWVCRTCNQGWLNQMEQDSFPVVEGIIIGEKISLSTEDQKKLARLAVSIAVTGEWLSTAHVSTTQEERNHFRINLEPPPGWYVFVGRNASDLITPFRHSDGVRSVTKSGNGPRDFASHTMAMGPLLLHVICLKPDDFVDVDMYARQLNLASIYPTTEWIAFGAMPKIDTAGVARVSSYMRMMHRAMSRKR